MGKNYTLTSNQVSTSAFSDISTNRKNLLSIIIPGLLLFLSLGVKTSFAQKCGPGHHWIDNCTGGVDVITQSGAIAGIGLNPSSCALSMNLILEGSITVRRQAAADILVANPTGCDTPKVDGHKDVILTEIENLNLTCGSYTLIAGKPAAPELRQSLGAIIELRGNDSLGCSFFDIFFKLVTPMGTLYNHQPLRIRAFIDRVPPEAGYDHLMLCIGLYDSPDSGQGTKRANLVTAEHITTPNKLTCAGGRIPTHIVNLLQGIYAENSKSVSVSWQMPFEQDHSFYLSQKDDNIYIERSRDGVEFKQIGAVVKSSNTNTTNYAFTDPYPLPVGYYRLQFYSNGRLSYSQVITVVSAASGKLTISPNPTSGKVKLLLNNMQSSAADVTVYDSYGRLVLSRRIEAGGQPEIDISGLPNGTYMVQCRHNGVVYQQKLLKK